MTDDDFREIALAQPGAEERAHMGHPDFRANGRIFASLPNDDGTGMVKLAPEEQAQLIREHPAIFTPAAGAWGRQGYTLVHLARATARILKPAVQLAWQGVAQKAPPRSRPRRPR